MTSYHGLNTPARGAPNWDGPLNDNFRSIDEKLPIVDIDANTGNYTPKEDAIFIAYDTGRRYRGDGSNWNELPSNVSQLTLDDDEPLYFGDAPDYSVRYDSTNDYLQIRDEGDSVDVMRFLSTGGNVSIPNGTLTVSNQITASSGLQTAADLSDDQANTIWDYSNQWVPQTVLENDSVTVAGNIVALGGSTAVAHGDLSSVGAEDHHAQIQVSDSSTAVLTQPTDINFASNLTVTDDTDGTVTVDASGGSGSAVEVQEDGTSLTTDVTLLDFISGITATEPATDEIDLNIEPADFAGTHLSDDGSGNLTVDDDFVENTGDQMSGDLFIQDANGLVVGNTSKVTHKATTEFQVLGTGNNDGGSTVGRFSNDITSAVFWGLKSRATTPGNHSAVQDGDDVFSLVAVADDGNSYDNTAGALAFEVDGAVSDGGTPGRVRIETTQDGENISTPALEVDSNQDVGLPNGDLTSNDTNGAIEVDEEASLADAGKAQLSRDAAAHGYAFIEDVTNDEACLVYLGGGANTVEIIHDSGSGNNFTTTEDNDTTTNIYWDATNSQYEINNETGASATYAVEVLKA